jgi:hypothetical protein
MPKLLTFKSKCQIKASSDGKPPRISIVAYNGGLIKVGGWGPLVTDVAGLSMNASIPILIDHNSSVDGIAGQGVATIKDGRVFVSGNLVPGTDGADKITKLSRAGHQFQASIGVEPSSYRFIKAGESINVNNRQIKAGKGGFILVEKGTLREVSVVALGADGSTSVTIAARMAKKKGNSMEFNAFLESCGLQASDLTPALMTRYQEIHSQIEASGDNDVDDDIDNELVQARESARIAGVTKIAEKHPIIAARAVEEGWNMKRTELEVLRASRPKPPIVRGSNHDAANTPDILAAGFLMKMGRESLAEKTFGEAVAQRARDLRANHCLDLVKASFELNGRNVPHNANEMVHASFGASGIDLPVALGNVANKVLLEAYNLAPSFWRQFCRVGSVPNFKPASMIAPSFLGKPANLGHHGEFESGQVSEAVVTGSINTYGMALSVSRRNIIDDDLSLFDQTASALGKSAMGGLSDLVIQTLLSSSGFFTTGNKNYMSGASTALDISPLSSAITMMRKQRDADGRDLDIQPTTLLVTPTFEFTARSCLSQTLVVSGNTDVTKGASNPLAGSIKNVSVESRLENPNFTGNSSNAWYLFGPAEAAAMHVLFLNGQQSPTVEFFGLESNPTKLALMWRVYFDYGACMGDFRAAVKSKGEA